MNEKFPNLFSPFKIANTTIKNRLTIAPMGDGYLSLLGPRGEYSWQGMEHCIERARGGFGLMINGCILFADNKVEDIDPISAILDNRDIFIKQGLKVNERCSYYDMKIFQQVTMGLGRNWGMMSCSENPWFDDPTVSTDVLTKDQIRTKIDCVVETCKIMKAAGFAGVEVHALHWGYLLDNFAMAITNHREDEYGGSLENRMRVCKEIIEGIKQECGKDYPVTMRLGLKSYMKGFNKPSLDGEEEVGRTLEEGLRIAKMLEDYGYDALNVDAGTYDSFYYACPPIYMPQGHCIPLAEKCKQVVSIPVICGSRMNDPFMCEKGISEGKFDAVAIGRSSLADPEYAIKVQTGKTDSIRPCIGCLVGCMGKSRSGEVMTCAVNPTAYLEDDYKIQKSLRPRKIAVIGAGISGMEVARTASIRGFDVTLFEKEQFLGGNLALASKQWRKEELLGLVNWYKKELEHLNVTIKTKTLADKDMILKEKFDIVVVATGASPIIPEINGFNDKKCIAVSDLIRSEDYCFSNAIIIGGGLMGCETAIDLANRGIKATIVEKESSILSNDPMIPIMVEQMIYDLLEKYNIRIITSSTISEIDSNGISITRDNGLKEYLKSDKIVFATGMQNNNVEIFEDLFNEGIEVFTVGDALNAGNVYTSIHSAFEVARNL